MTKLTVYDIMILQHHFADKKKKSAKDKELAASLEAALVNIAEGLLLWKSAPQPLEK